MADTADLGIYFVTPLLAGMRRPTPQDLPKLEKLNVHGFVSVQDDREALDEVYVPYGIKHCWVPTKGGTPPTQEQIATIESFVKEMNAQGSAVAIHCSSGNRRTGTVLAALLIKGEKMSCEDAVAKVQAVNPKADLRQAQLDFLQTISAE